LNQKVQSYFEFAKVWNNYRWL